MGSLPRLLMAGLERFRNRRPVGSHGPPVASGHRLGQGGLLDSVAASSGASPTDRTVCLAQQTSTVLVEACLSRRGTALESGCPAEEPAALGPQFSPERFATAEGPAWSVTGNHMFFEDSRQQPHRHCFPPGLKPLSTGLE